MTFRIFCPIGVSFWRSAWRLRLCVALFFYLQFAIVKPLRAEDHIAIKWQDYQEDDGRIRVVSKYVGVEKKINASLTLRAHGVHDAISGATPTGSSGRAGDEVPLEDLVDTRDAGVVDLDWTRGIHETSFQFAHSKESDYLSRGLAVYGTSEFDKRNTGLSYGLSFVDDRIEPAFFESAENKETYDAYVGLSRVLDPNTIVSLNFTYGWTRGFQDDPYKRIAKNIEVLPGFFLFQVAPENRPAHRDRRIWFANLKRFFPVLRGSLDFDFRYFSDTWGVDSQTFDIEWYQRIGDKLILRPSYRLYRQGAADFYFRDLNGVDIDPREPDPTFGPFFSADYRLAGLRSETYGLKLVYKIAESVDLDVAWERYKMTGREADTPEEAFPSADTLTIGGVWRF